MGKTENNNNQTFPKIVSTAPCDEDLFEGRSHTHIASKIADSILEGKIHGIIGIDGSWGSGKSNLVGLTRKAIDERIKEKDKDKPENEKRKYVFVTFDAWAHHTDYLRRSILEEFISDLIHKEILDKSWNDNLDMLLAKVREIDTKKMVKLNELILGSTFLTFFIPIINAVLSFTPYRYVIDAIVALIVAIWIYCCRKRSMKKNKQWGKESMITELFRMYVDKSNIESKPGYNEANNKNSEYKTIEFITEKEPTTRQFRDWMDTIDKELVKKKVHVIFVIDNMDRLPIAKVKEIWSTIHAFFAEREYKMIQTVIPFDRSHIINAFKEENIQELAIAKAGNDGTGDKVKKLEPTEVKSYGNDFINKTFFVVYRVSPPILTDWKDYFEMVWKEAFGTEIYKKHDEIKYIFGKLSKDFTPRSIIAFINECVTIYSIMGNQIPSEYLGLYIIGKEDIEKAPDSEIMNPQFLGPLEGRYDKEVMARNLSAIHYQIDKDKALDVVFAPKVLKAMDDGNTDFIKEFNNDRVLDSLLTDAINEVSNISNGIDFLAAIDNREKPEDYDLETHWKNLFETLKASEMSYPATNFDKHHAVLLKHYSDKKGAINFFLSRYLKLEPNWKIADYVGGINTFRELAQKEVDDFFAKNKKITVDNEVFDNLLVLTSGDYKNYGLDCEMVKFDEYLSTKSLEQFMEIEYLPILHADGIKLTKTGAKLCEMAMEAKQADQYAAVYKRLREITDPTKSQIQVGDLYTDDVLQSVTSGIPDDSEAIYDLVAMRIARGREYPTTGGYVTAFAKCLAKTDLDFVGNVAKVLPYYVDYGSFMVSLNSFSDKSLVAEIARLMTRNSVDYPLVVKNKAEVLQNYQNIIDVSGVSPEELLGLMQQLEGDVDYGTLLNWPVKLFEHCKDIKLDLARSINSKAEEQLREITKETWMKQLAAPAKELDVWKVYKFKVYNLKDAAITLLKDYVVSNKAKPGRALIDEALSVYEGDEFRVRESFAELYQDVLSHVSSDKIAYFTPLLFKWGTIHSAEEISQLYKTELINDAVITELIGVRDYLNSIELPVEFVSKMADLALGAQKSNADFVSFCNENPQIKSAIDELTKPKEESGSN